MRRYLAPLVLAAWCLALAVNCGWPAFWVALLLVAVVFQAAHHRDAYRRRGRRR